MGRQTVYQWHAYRAKFATDMLNEGTPPGHVAKLGGWKDGSVVLQIYDPPDDEALTRSLPERGTPMSHAG